MRLASSSLNEAIFWSTNPESWSMTSCPRTVVATATFLGELPVSVMVMSGVCPALSAPLLRRSSAWRRCSDLAGPEPRGGRGLARLGLGLDHLAHVCWVGRKPLERRGSGVRLPEVERRRRLVHLVSAEGEDIADDQPGDEAETGSHQRATKAFQCLRRSTSRSSSRSAKSGASREWSRARTLALMPRNQAVEPRVPDQVQALVVGDDRRVLPVRERPHLLARHGIERVRAVVERGEVDDPVQDGGRPGVWPCASNSQRTSPVAASNAKSFSLYEPAKTRCLHTAGEE